MEFGLGAKDGNLLGYPGYLCLGQGPYIMYTWGRLHMEALTACKRLQGVPPGCRMKHLLGERAAPDAPRVGGAVALNTSR